MTDKPQSRPKNLEKYPYCMPSYDSAVLEGRNIESWLKDKHCFGVTHCNVFEVIEGQCAWKWDINEMGLQAYLQVLPPSPIYLSLSGPFLRNIELQRIPEVAYLSSDVSIASFPEMESLSESDFI